MGRSRSRSPGRSLGLLDGLFGTEQALAPFRAAPLGATMLLDVRDAARAEGVARTIERGLFAQGVEADSVQSLLDQADRADRASSPPSTC